MSPDFVGHGNNMYHLFTNSGNPGYDSFVPMIGARSKRPLESVHIGGFEGDGNGAPPNFSSSIQLLPGQGGNLASALKNAPKLDLQSNSMKFVMQRLAANAQGSGLLSNGARKMWQALEKAPSLAETLQKVTVGQTVASDANRQLMDALDIALAYFKGGVTSSVTIMYDGDPMLDTHGASSASKQPKLFADVLAGIEAVFAALKQQTFDEATGLSFFDVTTFVVTTEFSRTMRQSGQDVGSVGTDHNPYTNTMLIGGKGIKGGQVIGASDLDAVDEAGDFVEVSGAHTAKDGALNCIMGRPFDFSAAVPRADLPAEFKLHDYLTSASVVNTLLELFSVPAQNHFRIGGVQAPVLKSLLKA